MEIKSGKDYRRHTALDNILSVGEWKFEEAVVFCMDNVSTDGKETYLPWYMSMFLKMPQPESYIVDADFSGLSAASLIQIGGGTAYLPNKINFKKHDCLS